MIFWSQAGGGLYLGRSAGHQDHLGLTAFSLCFQQSILREAFAEPYHARTAQPITTLVPEPLEVERAAEPFERRSTWNTPTCALHVENASVQLQNVARPGASVQSVYVLGGDDDARDQVLQLSQRPVTRVRRGREIGRDPLVVPSPDETKIRMEAVQGGELLEAAVAPVPVRPTKRAQPPGHAQARAGQNENALGHG